MATQKSGPTSPGTGPGGGTVAVPDRAAGNPGDDREGSSGRESEPPRQPRQEVAALRRRLRCLVSGRLFRGAGGRRTGGRRPFPPGRDRALGTSQEILDEADAVVAVERGPEEPGSR